MMAKKLDLKVENPSPQNVTVSWNDTTTVAIGGGSSLTKNFNKVVGVSFFAIIAISFVTFYFWLILLWLIIFIPIGISYRMAFTERNMMTFGKSEVHHKDQQFPTKDITRFDYGLRSALTGVQPKYELPDPTIVRLWLGDSKAYEVSANLWDMQVNHEIHATLTKALEAVRDIDKQQEHEQEFGKVSNDTGMPDY